MHKNYNTSTTTLQQLSNSLTNSEQQMSYPSLLLLLVIIFGLIWYFLFHKPVAEFKKSLTQETKPKVIKPKIIKSSYCADNLISGEQILYRTKLHKIMFVPPVIIAMFMWTLAKAFPERATLFYFIATIVLVWKLIVYITSEFCITNKRVLIKVGFIKRKSLEILLTKVEGIFITQNIPGRIFGYGSIVVNGTGGTREPFAVIANPLEFRHKLQEVM